MVCYLCLDRVNEMNQTVMVGKAMFGVGQKNENARQGKDEVGEK